MGGSVSRLFSYFFSQEEARLLVRRPGQVKHSADVGRGQFVGLDAAGKTTMLYKLKLGEIVTTIPTIGFNVETITYKGIAMTSWDVGGRGKMRALWRHYMTNTDGVIMVIDSNDRERIDEAREDLERMLREDEIRTAALLVFANKQDLPNAMSVQEITDKLGLYSIRNRQWYIQAACATSGDGLYEGLDWLSGAIRKTRRGEWKISGDKRFEGEGLVPTTTPPRTPPVTTSPTTAKTVPTAPSPTPASAPASAPTPSPPAVRTLPALTAQPEQLPAAVSAQA